MNYLSIFLDILVIALIFYTVLLFLKRSHSFLVFFGMTIALSLYGFAKVLNLGLTLVVLQYFIGVSVILFAVVFQTEIRKYFELLGLIGSRQIKVGKFAPKSPEITELISTCVELAKKRWGALIVIKGRDEVEGFFEGGIELDGVISEEVILSIFCPASEGHDGALLISNNRISKFAIQLPLSINFKEIGKRGTRHSAGLGISERSDALCIIISEERGSISVCRDGTFKTLQEYEDLEKELNSFTKAKYSSQSETVLEHIIKHNFQLKFIALLSAVVLWFVTRN